VVQVIIGRNNLNGRAGRMRTAFGPSFDVSPGYLNTASIGIPPLFAADAVAQAVESRRTGSDRSNAFDTDVAAARKAWASLIGVAPENVTIGTSVSQLVGLIATSVQDGTQVLAVAGEFTSVIFPFAAQAYRGVTVTEVEPTELVSRVNGHDLIAVSVVQSADGAIADVDRLRDAAAASGARVLLDVTQAAGWLPLRLGWADWVVGASYKWLLSPRGAAWLALRSDALEWTVPHAANWYAATDPWSATYGLPLRLAADARRLDLSPVWFAQRGAAAALPWLATLDIAAVYQHCVGLADSLLAKLRLPPRGSAIVALDLPGAAERLAAAGITATSRAGRSRLSFHLYNTAEDVEMAVAALRGR
jgi:selenocysteine lyase/cysteine desulfurase